MGWYGVECVSQNDCSSGDLCVNFRCEQDPCEFVECDDFCSGGERSSNGFCRGGQCIYEENNCDFGCSGDFCSEDPCIGVDTSDRCENGRWLQEGICSHANVNFGKIDTCKFGCQDEPVGFLSIVEAGGLCRSTPCEGVVCEDYCSGTTLFTGGECNSGKCEYSNSNQEKFSGQCGHTPFFQRTSTQIGLAVLVLILILIAVAVVRRRRK